LTELGRRKGKGIGHAGDIVSSLTPTLWRVPGLSPAKANSPQIRLKYGKETGFGPSRVVGNRLAQLLVLLPALFGMGILSW
jgi:hypothetical protein